MLEGRYGVLWETRTRSVFFIFDGQTTEIDHGNRVLNPFLALGCNMTIMGCIGIRGK